MQRVSDFVDREVFRHAQFAPFIERSLFKEATDFVGRPQKILVRRPFLPGLIHGREDRLSVCVGVEFVDYFRRARAHGGDFGGAREVSEHQVSMRFERADVFGCERAARRTLRPGCLRAHRDARRTGGRRGLQKRRA